jgi:predicted ATP-dependent endonuclease of OLD family
MQIIHVDIQNFRKLKVCRVEFSKKETIFVGANNSGKTSAMDALMLFLKKRKEIRTTDFTLSNWSGINDIGTNWVSCTDENALNLAIAPWESFMPAIDVWLHVEDNEVHYVSHLIPTLDWSGGVLGVRLILEPKNVEELYKGYKAAYVSAKSTTDSRPSGTSLSLWPQNMRDFMDKELYRYFVVKAYILDPSKQDINGPQILPAESGPLDGDPFDGLFKIDIINAQRGFSDPNDGDGFVNTDRRLSSQLRQYFDKHLNPAELPDASDLDALESIEIARGAFDEKLRTSFRPAIEELEDLNYPGFDNPSITLSSKVNPLEGLDHDAAVQFDVVRNTPSSSSPPLRLPEKYNGLGYQNLISMVFNLIRFRDEWMRVGKAGKRESEADNFIEPLHLVLIEEPEAHLHAQVQQVFIKKAYGVLRKHSNLGEKNQFSTQMVISTHSSHIAHEIDFTNLRYFRREPVVSAGDVPCATVVNLTTTFGSDEDTSRFATRYLKTTHCDLFFADAAILIEGAAEKMLIPHFIRCKFPELDRSYISLLEIGGSHAHRLKPLIDALGLLTLIITDLDSISADDDKKVRPEIEKGYKTGNDTLKGWIPKKTQLDELLKIDSKDKETADSRVRVAFPSTISVTFADDKNKKEDAIPYTFEDALVLNNLDFFRKIQESQKSTGLLKKMVDTTKEASLNEAITKMFDALKKSKKAEMALELLWTIEPNDLQPPKYIQEGLEWLQNKLKQRGEA